ncbi:PREDICTED: DNA repair endonuclease UVH1 isoform X2 [Nelumbo nucifera]|uniref:DNA repair endonuclease UVH1 isoform X2 n=1 Tax=Nelumbo nucifera TaxID=4432 RepID=A0A1U8BDS8_NELNU|nr:PREDICTED: DNA repair endonuclease UVH1 isoform X2 [Nelumbo nucifera]
MVQFHEHIISDLLEDSNGGLVILSSGLALHKLIASLLLLHSPSQGTLLILSASPSQKSSITQSLQSLQNPNPNPDLPTEITSDLSAQLRHSLYSSGSIFFITSRILIVDLLNSKVPTSNLAGLIILNAHNLSETCTEAFIVRIFRSLNRTAYVRAFSDKPHAMVSGFSKAERIMKCLFVRRLHLWPRFQVYVSQDLERDPPTVVDIRVQLSPLMNGIQKAVIEVMDACLKEMQKTNKVDVEDLTVEKGLFKSFDEIVRRQLDPIWHTLGMKTKQLVWDLKTLRKLVDYLVRYDAVAFLKYLDTLRVSEGVRSVWIFADSSHKIFEFAKKRVYQVVRSDGVNLAGESKSVASKRRKVKGDASNEKNANGDSAGTSANSGIVLEEILEEAPKWKVLREVLEEIAEERQNQALSREGELMVEGVEDSSLVLVACKDERSCMQLEDYIMKGPQPVMREEWEKYLWSKVDLHGLQTHNRKKYKEPKSFGVFDGKFKEPKGFGILNGVLPSTHGQNAETASISKLERDALLAAASGLSNPVAENISIGDNPPPTPGVGGCGKGKVKRRGKKALVNAKSSGCEDDVKKREKTNRSETCISDNEGKSGENDPVEVDDFNKGEDGTLYIQKGFLRKHNQGVDAKGLTHAKPLPPVHFHALESEQHNILDDLKPSVIVVYHPDMAFVREIEIYKAENPLARLKVYFLFYEDSTEVQKFEASIRRENGAFESLIRQKSLMIIPVDQDGRCLGLTSSYEAQSLASQNSVTRKAGGRKEVEKDMQVIVDMREFASSLPNVLHQRGMRIIPVTLEVGDYVLSPLICVERKSLQDLFQSFSSGRLYHQVETMVRYYRIPVLLIEFSQDKSFSFQSASEIGDDVSPTNIISKLSLLALHFPRLRIIWSRSLHATAEIFASLKANQDEPDESKAMRVGVPTDDGIVENDVRAETYNTSAVEFLRRFPGVTDSNYRAIMDGCNSLAELALLPVEKLAELMGGQKAARTLRDFLDAKYPSML